MIGPTDISQTISACDFEADRGVVVAVVLVIEYHADSLSERRLGAFGIRLILCGFALQSFQYWLQLLDVKVR